jgi:betaine-aldehyde dehydrogenase
MSEIPLHHCFINGQPRATVDGARLTIRNPATNQPLAEVEVALDPEIEAAVQAARTAQREWAGTTGAERGRILHRTAQLLRDRNAELARLEVLNTGKPIAEAESVDVVSGAEALEYFAGIAPAITGQHIPLGRNFAYTRREPLGVVAGLGAWNYPIQIACWKAAPALAAGNAMLFKPSELTPLTSLKLAEIFQKAGLPDGLFSVLPGDARTGRALVAHPGIAKVSLTGGVDTGREVARAAAAQLKPVTLELGGKSPLIIFEDAHLDNAVAAALLANFYTQGEICSNGTRVFVQKSVSDAFLEKLQRATAALTIGDPLDPGTQVGSLISESHCRKVLDYIRQGREEGAKLVCGGRQWGETGNFVEPTIFAGVRDEMTIAREEIFGPVLSLLEFESEEEVVRRANDTPFGLAAGVFTRDLNRAHRMVAALEAGTCWINTYNITPLEVPFGGYKQSGLGRENSMLAIDHYTQTKSVYVETGDLS